MKPQEPAEPTQNKQPEPCRHPLDCMACETHCCHNCVWRENTVDIEPGDVLAFWCEREFHRGALVETARTSLTKKRFKNGYPTAPCTLWSPRWCLDPMGKKVKVLVL